MASAQSTGMILLIGDIMLDRYLVGTVDRISPEAPVPVLRVSSSFHRPGGAGNVASNIVAMGGACRLLGVVGDDDTAAHLRNVLTIEGVGSDGVITSATIPTTTKTRLLAGHHQLARFDQEANITDSHSLAAIHYHVETQAATSQLVVISDYGKGVCSDSVCRSAIALARTRRTPVIVDPKGRDYSKYSGATVVTPNRREAIEAADMPIPDVAAAIEAARVIQRRYEISSVVVTLGDQGMAVVDGERSSVVPGQPKKVFDVTGAGDTVVAVLAVMLCEGMPLLDACIMANVAGALQVSRIGTSRITRNEVTTALNHRDNCSNGNVPR